MPSDKGPKTRVRLMRCSGGHEGVEGRDPSLEPLSVRESHEADICSSFLIQEGFKAGNHPSRVGVHQRLKKREREKQSHFPYFCAAAGLNGNT